MISENKVPLPFLIMLLLQFILIIGDRGFYLRKYIFGKFIYQILLVVAIHIWMFFILPAINNRCVITPVLLYDVTKLKACSRENIEMRAAS